MIQTDPKVLEGGEKYSDKLNHYVIYSLINLDNGKRYIGRTQNPKKRIKAHLTGIKSHKHPNEYINKDSNCRFGFEIIDNDVPYDEWEKEKYYMLLYRTYNEKHGYNMKDMCLSGVIHLLQGEVSEEYIRDSLLKNLSAEFEKIKNRRRNYAKNIRTKATVHGKGHRKQHSRIDVPQENESDETG